MPVFLLMFTNLEDICAYLFAFRWHHHSLGAYQTRRFLGSKFYWILCCNKVFGGFDGLSSVSHSKIAAKNAYLL